MCHNVITNTYKHVHCITVENKIVYTPLLITGSSASTKKYTILFNAYMKTLTADVVMTGWGSAAAPVSTNTAIQDKTGCLLVYPSRKLGDGDPNTTTIKHLDYVCLKVTKMLWSLKCILGKQCYEELVLMTIDFVQSQLLKIILLFYPTNRFNLKDKWLN